MQNFTHDALLAESTREYLEHSVQLPFDDFPMMPASGHFTIGDSQIHGKGVIALRDIPTNTNLGPGIIKGGAAFAEFFRRFKSEEAPDQAKRLAEINQQLKEKTALAAKEAAEVRANGASAKDASAAEDIAAAAAAPADVVTWQLGYTNWINHAKRHTVHAVSRTVGAIGADGSEHEGSVFDIVTSRVIRTGEELAIYYPDIYAQLGIAHRIEDYMLEEDQASAPASPKAALAGA